jgi:hypothetical protein
LFDGRRLLRTAVLPALTCFVTFTRAREAPSSGASRPTRRCADATDPVEPALRLLADVDAPDFLFRGILFRDCGWGPTMELERMELGRSAALVRWRTMLRSMAPPIPF